MIHWTGRSVIVAVRHTAIAARVFGSRPFRLYPVSAWSLANGQVSDLPLDEVDATDRQVAIFCARLCLEPLDSQVGRGVHQADPATYYGHRLIAKEHWLGSFSEARSALVDRVRAQEQTTK